MDKFSENSKKTSCEATASAYSNPEQIKLNQPSPVPIHTQIVSSKLTDFSFESLRDIEDDIYHQRQRERITMNFKTLKEFEEFNGELKENLQKKSNLVSIFSHTLCKYNAIFRILSS
jgi:hypothetical protein